MNTPLQPALAASAMSSSSSAKLIVTWAIHSLRRSASAMARNRSLARAMCSGRVPMRLSSTTSTPLLADQAELPHDVRDGSLPVAGSVDRRHAAEAAVQGAAARGLDGPEEVARRQQVMTRRRDVVQFGAASVVAALQVAVLDVVQDLPPDGLGLPRDHRIHALHDFVCAGGRVNAAHDDGDAETPEVRRPLRRRGSPAR